MTQLQPDDLIEADLTDLASLIAQQATHAGDITDCP